MAAPDFVLELRKHIGHAPLWLIGVTAVVVRDGEILLVQRADNGQWAPITGIVDPGEHPVEAAAREAREEAGVQIAVRRLASVSVTELRAHVNGDQAQYLDHTVRCDWVSGEAHVADDESVDVGWFPIEALPPMNPGFLERIDAALSEETATRLG